MTERNTPPRADNATERQIQRMQERLKAKVAAVPMKDQLGLCAAPLEWDRVDQYAERSRCGNYTVSTAYVRGIAQHCAWAKGPNGKFHVVDDIHPTDREHCKRSCQEHADHMVQVEEARNADR